MPRTCIKCEQRPAKPVPNHMGGFQLSKCLECLSAEAAETVPERRTA